MTYSPTSNSNASGSFSLQYDNGYSAQSVSFSLSATGRAFLSVAPSEGSYSFDYAVPQNQKDHTFVITNSGVNTATLDSFVSGFSLGLASPFSIIDSGASDDCLSKSILIPSDHCSLGVRFAPSALGIYSDSVELPYSDGFSAKTFTIEVAGTVSYTHLTLPTILLV